MAMRVEPLHVGVDVSKDELVICERRGQALLRVRNEPRAIRAWLDELGVPAYICVEATNTFHVTLLEEAHRRGHTLYVVDGYRLNRYRESIGARAKTDATDAELLARYLERERVELRPWSPPPKGYVALQRLLHRRATLVRARVALEQSLRDLPELKRSAATVLRQLARLDTLIDKHIRQALHDHGWNAHARRCQGIEGIGPITGAALVMAFHRGAFRHSDAFVAFLGLDVRVRDSGQSKGRRRLTKKGDPELRRLLYLAAMNASRSATWRPFYHRHLERGLSRTQALVVLARKLARVAFAVLKTESTYQPKLALGT